MGVKTTSQSKGYYNMSKTVDIERILLELELLPKYDNQIMLQGLQENLDPFYGVTNPPKKRQHGMRYHECITPIFDMPYTNSIIKDLYRTRVMKMSPGTCYTYHTDPTERVHIPLITNENCFFIIDDEVVRLPANGSIYHVDTTKKHTFVNASIEDRIHIVGCKFNAK